MFGKRLSLVLVVLCGALSAQGYEEDTHYSLTYVLMRLACFSHKEALAIASADQGVDDNWETDPKLASHHNPKWHALDDSRELVLARKQQLWSRASASKNLVDLGQYFHYQQDHWGHREVKGENWKPYGPVFGHAKDLHQPDRVPWDKETARQMARQCFAEAKQYLKDVLGRQPSDVDDSIIPALIDAMCLPYRRDAFGMWNEVDANDVAIQLDNIARKLNLEGKIKKPIHTPSTTRKVPYKYDDTGHVTNQGEADGYLARIDDYNFIDPGAIKPRETIDGFLPPLPPPTTSWVDGGTGTYNGVTFEAKVTSSVELIPTEETKGGPIEWCYRTCRGGTHSKHSECDPSCNENCRLSHGDDVLRAHTEYFPDAVRSAVPDLENSVLPPHLRGPAFHALEMRVSEMLNVYSQDTFTPPANHFSVFCGCTMRQYGYRKYQLKLHAKVESTRKQEGKEDQKQVKVSEAIVAYVWQPDGSKPLVKKDYVNCVCEKTATSIVPSPKGGVIAIQPSPGAQVITPGPNPNAVPPVDVIGNGINDVTVPPVSGGGQPLIIYIPAGGLFVPDDPMIQTMMVREGAYIEVPMPPGGPGVYGALAASPDQQPKTVQKIAVSCLNFDRQPPRNTKLHLAPWDNSMLRRLGLAAERQMMKGAWDQERAWIFTDKVPYEKAAARVMPSTPKGFYLNALWDLSTMCWLDLRKEEFRSLLDPSLILNTEGNAKAWSWFVGWQDGVAPNDLAKTLGSKMPDVLKGLTPDKATFAVELFRSLHQAKNDVLHDVIGLLMESLPTAIRQQVEKQVFTPKPIGR